MTEFDKPLLQSHVSNPVTALLPFVTIVFFGFLAIGVPLPVIPVEVHDTLGFSPVTAGWAVGIQSLATVLTRQSAGRLCDVSGPRAAVMSGLPLASLAGVLYLLATAFSDPLACLAILLLGRILLGVAESLFLTGAMAWGIARVGPAHTGKVMAWQGIAIYSAVGIGAPIGIELMARWNFAGAAFSTALLPIVGVFVALALPRPDMQHRAVERVPFYRVIGLIWRHGLAMSLATAPFAALAAFVALYYASRGWTGAGYPVMGFGAGYIVMRLFFAGLPDRMGGARVAVISLPAEFVGQLVLFGAPNSGVALIGAVLTGVGFSLVFPSMGVEAVRRVPAHSRGLAVGGFVAFFDLALGLTGPLAGLVVSGFGYRAIFIGGALCCAIAYAMIRAFAVADGQKA